MRIEWINHAGFLLETDGCSVAIDPWINGLVFDESWSHIAKTEFAYSDFSRATHIWFSHEHPDHFFPPNLKMIPPTIRAGLQVLFRETPDKRVIDVCRKLGFSTIELSPQWYRIGPDLEIFCQDVSRVDSWAAFRAHNHTLLNLNDCICLTEDDLIPIKNAVGHIDTLVTQFSYASWWGNPDQPEKWRAAAADQLAKIQREIAVLQPRFVVLSASFVYFCHSENWYMNEWANSVEAAFNSVSESSCQPIVLHPGETWEVGAPHNSQKALACYRDDLQSALAAGPLKAVETVALTDLEQAASAFVNRLRLRNSRLLLWRIKPTRVFLTDHRRLMRLSLAGLTEDTEGRPDIALSSEAMLYCLKYDWGGETLMVNGRFSVPFAADKSRFFRWFSIADANRHNTHYDLRYYAERVRSKMMRL